ncbi:MAG: AmmeMemoRadiSam system protein B [Gammaproteobacteria bacterium]|nr:AmmeMemoRadiSam system protein B [Gammaproteobacteria bacterium]MCP5424891.1 AmmeMemoRadiSam system protein B [Gammaproteobacteria bacterium]MCP5458133.1 AmmeMemoRadiSam system protein B [Gammaproteobacteria bacterium]
MLTVRQPAVAGMFYPADPTVLHQEVRGFLDQVATAGPVPKAIIVPHAGYVYSGPVAASAYARLQAANGSIRRVVLLGPSHRVGFNGIAVSGMQAFATPLGLVPLDYEAIARIRHLPQVVSLERAHEREHSLEVHLPFLQEVLGEFNLVPLVVGTAEPQPVGEVLEILWGGPETLLVISSDLSHYHDYETARRLDAATSRAIEGFRYEDIVYESACGRNPVNGLLWAARRRDLKVETLDLRNSGDTAGPRDQVVGYGSYAFSE